MGGERKCGRPHWKDVESHGDHEDGLLAVLDILGEDPCSIR